MEEDPLAQCDHPVRVAGMCAVCGRVLDDDDPSTATAGQDSAGRQSSMNAHDQQLHDISGIKVSTAEAQRLDSESTTRLLSQKKLALIVDLDQTIIHATVDPTVGEWMKDASNPNFAALADVGKFLLGADGKEVLIPDDQQKEDNEGQAHDENAERNLNDGCWYYVKPRPGLPQFLRKLSEKYEMHVYTMGTRTYAESVCRLVDPQGSIFGARIISRDENGSLVQKSLKKLFPMDTSMVVIIDDRADVWQWSPNLIRVSPFDFFVGIGDINASFLPSIPAGPTPTPEALEGIAKSDKEANSSQAKDESLSGTVDAAAEAKAKAEDDAAKSVAEESQKSTVSEQIDARPLAKMQEALEGKEDEGKAGQLADSKIAADGDRARHEHAAVLKETDRELDKLQGILEDVHARWYAQYAEKGESEEKPMTQSIISLLKTTVLDGCTVVFSSIAPLQQDPTTTDLWRLASEFGAVCKRAIDASVTHVVTAKQGTEKVIQGHRRGIHVVWFTWLQESCSQWSRQSETQFQLPRVSSSSANKKGDGESSTKAIASSSKSADLAGPVKDANETIDTDGLSETASERADGTGVALAANEAEEDDDEQGFGEMNWDEANDEVDAVLMGLGDDDDGLNDDDESVYDSEDVDGPDMEHGEANGVKRRRSQRSDQSDVSADGESVKDGESRDPRDAETLSPLSKRRRMAELRFGQSRLKNVITRDASQAPSSTGAASEAAGDDKQIDEAAGPSGLASSDPNQGAAAAGQEDEEDFLRSLEDELELQLGADESGEGAAAPS